MSTLIVELFDIQLHKLERLAQQRGTSVDALVRAVLDDLAAQSDYDQQSFSQVQVYTFGLRISEM
jgi:hypothetical protein